MMKHILPPSEIDQLTRHILADVGQQAIPPAQLTLVQQCLAAFSARWQASFTRFGQQPGGELAYRDALLDFQETVAPLARRWLPATGPGQQALTAIEGLAMTTPPPVNRLNRQLLTQLRQQRQQRMPLPELFADPLFDRPLFIVSAPRAGSTLLFETLARFAEVWTIGRESHDIEADIPTLHPAAHQYGSNRLTAGEATPEVSLTVRRWFSQRLQNRSGASYLTLPPEQRPTAVRFLEKTPKNALRIPWLRAIFPDAKFLFLYRAPQQNISSLLEGWRTRRFVAYRAMPGWPYKEWSFLLTPGWEMMVDRPLAEIAAHQWRTTNQQILDDLRGQTDWFFVTYQALTERPAETIRQISQFADLQWDELVEHTVADALPLSQMVISPPSPDKWRRHAAEIAATEPMVDPVIRQIEALVAEPAKTR